MREAYREAEEAFYRSVAAILGCPYDYVPWTGRGPNRWNNRHAGNGRFPGYGTVRFFGPNLVHVSLQRPEPVNRTLRSPAEALALLEIVACRTNAPRTSP